MNAAIPAPLPPSVAGRSVLGPLDLALQHAARGWLVLPTRNKQPLTRHGVKDATCDPERLRRWWASRPGAEPAVTGVDVLDVDRKPGQPDPLDALRTAGLDVAELPPGMYAGISRGGAGCHVFGVGNVGNGRPLPGVDGRGRDTVGVLFDAVAVPPGSDWFEWHWRARCGHVLSDAAVLRLTSQMKPGLRDIRAALAAVCDHEQTCPVSPSK